MTETKSMESINAEKASKPRPDLLPLSFVAQLVTPPPGGHAGIQFALIACCEFLRSKNTIKLIDAARYLAVAYFHENTACLNTSAASAAEVLLAVGEIMAMGWRKHGPCTWRVAGTEQADPQTHFAGAIRHMLEAAAGRAVDPDSGKDPLLHAICQLAITYDLVTDPPTVIGGNDGHTLVVMP